MHSSSEHTRAARKERPRYGTNAHMIRPARLERKVHDLRTSRRAGATDVHRYALLGLKWPGVPSKRTLFTGNARQ